jgi:hypothetical protein
MSTVATAAFTINIPVTATPAISPNGGSFTSPQTITITDATPGAIIYFTTDGSTPPSATASRYIGPFSIAQSETIKSIADSSSAARSLVAAATFNITLPTK